MRYTKKQIDALIEGIYNGNITVRDLPVDLYEAIANKLLGALGTIEKKASPALLNELRENLYIFSGAKTYQQINDISLIAEDESIKSFKDFKNEALAIYEQYNQNWLETEYRTAIGQAQTAVRWEQIEAQKETLPYLQYSAVIDNNTSEICLPLDGVCLPVDDPFWDTNAPLNHFNCRCLLIQHDKEDAQKTGITSNEEATAISEEMNKERQPLFNMNSGKDKVIFDDKHPYFEVPPKDKEFAKENFGLPIPEEVKGAKFEPVKNPKQAREFVSSLIKNEAGLTVDKVMIDSGLTLEELNVRLETMDGLFKEYNISPAVTKENPVSVSFKSSNSSYGYIQRTQERLTKDTWITKMNFGSKTDGAINRTFNEFATSRNFKSNVDLANMNKTTVVHEFAHVIGTNFELLSKQCPEYFKDFFKELSANFKSYTNEMLELNSAGKVSEVNKLSLGRYASKNINEFMAEAFTEYKLNSSPSKYAKIVGKLIDKNFKK
jgi:SPP1 gp7 family putative phage head morphogenesis protein